MIKFDLRYQDEYLIYCIFADIRLNDPRRTLCDTAFQQIVTELQRPLGIAKNATDHLIISSFKDKTLLSPGANPV